MLRKLIFLTFATPMISYGQWTMGGAINNYYGNSSSGVNSNQWKSVGIGNFQFFNQSPASRLHINELYLGAPISPNPLGNLFRTDGSNDVMNQWELFTGDIDVTSRKFRIYTNFDLQTQVNISQNYTLQNNQNAYIEASQRDLIINAGGQIERMRILGRDHNLIGFTPWYAIAKAGNVGIGTAHPMAMLAIGGEAAAGAGWRSWMDIGTLYDSRGGFDNMYVGLKNISSDKNEAIINWGNNPSSNPSSGDVLRFLFTAANNSANGISATTNGLEMMQMWTDGNNGRIGAGNFQTTFDVPLNTFEIFSSTSSPYFGSTNGSSGLKFRNMTGGNTPIVNPGQGVLALDQDGNVIYVNSTTSNSIGNYCGNPQNPLSGHYQIGMNNRNIYLPGQDISSWDNRIGAGVDCGTTLRARIHAVETGIGCTAGFFEANETNAPGLTNGTPTGAIGIAIGNGYDNSGFCGLRGFANGDLGLFNYAVMGIVTNNPTTPIERAAYFNGDIEGTTFGILSDQMFKTDINEINSALTTINKLNPKSFYFDTINHNEFAFNGKKQYGFIAQEVEMILPELVNESVNPGLVDSLGNFTGQPIHYKSLNYNAIIPITAKAVQELDLKFEKQTLSDASLKNNVQDLQNALDIVNSLRGVSYQWNQNNTSFQFDSTEHIGYIAQEVDTVDNRLTYLDSDSLLHVDYNKVVPIITEAIQELNQIRIEQDSLIYSLNDRLTQLENCINNLNLCSNEASYLTNPNSSLSMKNELSLDLKNTPSIILNQNVPNPFAEKTIINMEIPSTVKSAQLLFYNSEGKLIQTLVIDERGSTNVTVYANDLTSGIYTYTLISDGEVVGSKKMVKN
jgi:hypothetical protein